MVEITRVLEAVQQGDSKASAELFPMIYEELRKVACQKMAREGLSPTLQPTELVNEAWLRLAGNQSRDWKNRAHFFGSAAEAMRRILVERARRRNCLKRGGQWERVEAEEADIPSPLPDDDLLALDEALAKFAALDARKAELVKLRYFAGLTFEEAAEVLGIAVPTAKQWWAYARAWLRVEMTGAGPGGPQVR
jgi:RNA polymerase sigma factor (TIGR02999 family)